MGTIIKQYETRYNVGDVVIFEKNDLLQVRIIEGYCIDDNCFWFNIRVSSDYVYTYSDGEDIAEFDIIGVVDNTLKEDCINRIKDL